MQLNKIWNKFVVAQKAAPGQTFLELPEVFWSY